MNRSMRTIPTRSKSGQRTISASSACCGSELARQGARYLTRYLRCRGQARNARCSSASRGDRI